MKLWIWLGNLALTLARYATNFRGAAAAALCVLVVAGSHCQGAVGGGGVGGGSGGTTGALNEVPAGGSAGEVLAKASGTDYDLEWVTAGAGDITGVTAGTGLGGGGASGEVTLNITDAELVALLGLVSAADKVPYFTGSGTAALGDFPSFGRSLAAAASASAGRTLLEVVIGTNVQAWDADLDTLAGADVDATAVTFLETAFTDGQMAYSASGNWTPFATTAAGRAVMGMATNDLAAAGIANGVQIDAWGAKAEPTGDVVGTTDTQTLSSKTLTSPTLAGTITQTGVTAITPTTMAALEVDVTVPWNAKVTSTNPTFTFSDTIPAGVTVRLTITEGESAAQTVTIPSAFDPLTQTARTTFTLGPDQVVDLWFESADGVNVTVFGLPSEITDLTDLGESPASDDFFEVFDTSAGTPKKVSYADVGSGGGTDANAIHDNSSGEISAITAKATPIGADYLLIEDSAASDAKKSATIASLEGALEAVLDLQDLQGAVTDAQVPNTITVDAATLASTVTVVDGTDATSFPAIFDSATGSLAVKTDGALTYNASTGALAATSFSGTGTALTALNGENVQNDTIDDDSIDFGTSTDQVSAGDLPIADTGSIFTATDTEAALLELAKVPVKVTATSYTVGTTDPRELYGGVIYVTGAATITLPAVAAGAHCSVITIGAVAVSVDPNAADLIYLDGTALDDGDKVTNTSTAGDIAVFTSYDGTGWYAATNTWTDGGP